MKGETYLQDSYRGWNFNAVWEAIKGYDVVSVTLALCIFMGAFEYLFSFEIGGAEVRVFQLLLLFLSPLIFLTRRSFVFFLVANLALAVSSYYSVSNGYFESEAVMKKILIQQEMTLISIAVFLGVNYKSVNTKLVLRSNFYALMLAALLGFFQFVLYNVFHVYFNISKKFLGEHLRWRVYGFFSEPNMFSLYFVLAIPMFYAYLHIYHRNHYLVRMMGLTLVFGSLFLSFSRGALLGFFLVTYLEVFRKKGRLFHLSMLGVLVGTAMLLSIVAATALKDNEALYRLTSFNILKDPSASGRLDVFISLYNYSLKYGIGTVYTILLGNGLSSFRAIAFPFYSEPNYFAMNLYVDLLFEHGIIVFWLVIKHLVKLRRRFKRNEDDLLRILSLGLPCFFVVCLFYPIKNVIQYQLPFLFSIGLLLYAYRGNNPIAGAALPEAQGNSRYRKLDNKAVNPQ